MAKRIRQEIPLSVDVLSSEDRKAVEQVMEAGLRGEFWKYIKQVLQANIMSIELTILDDSDGMTKEEVDRWRDKRKSYQRLIETPEHIIQRMRTEPLPKVPNLDPYDSNITREETTDKI